jgi:hypothetical protein
VLASARAANALRTDACAFMGPDDEHQGAEPRVRLVHGAARSVFTSAAGGFASDGVWSTELGAARHAAVAADGSRVRVVVADASGVSQGAWPVHREGAALERTQVTRGDVRVLEAALSGDRLIVLYGLPDPVLGVLFVGPRDTRDVRLRLPAPVDHLDIEWVGEQLGVALRLETGQSMACVLDSRGSTRVKPYPVLGARADGSTPRVLWAERGFTVAVPCGADGSVRVLRVGAGREPEVVVEGAPGPLDAVYFAQRYYFASVQEGDAHAALRLRSVSADGSGAQTLSCPVLPEEGASRLRMRSLRDRLRAVAGELRAVGYRSGGAHGAGVQLDGATLRLRGAARGGEGAPCVEVHARAEAAGDELEVRWRAHQTPGPPSFPRLRRLFRVDRPPTAVEEEQLASLRELVSHHAEDVDTDADGCAVVFDLVDFPDVARLAAVLRTLAG